jgi:hypothetical protein
MKRVLAVFLFSFFTLGCEDAAVFFKGPPPPVPFVLDVLVDASEDSSGSPATATSVVTMAARSVADRPGSLIRVWVLGPTVGRTRIVSTATVPSPHRAGKRFREATKDAFLRDTLPVLLNPVIAALKEPAPRRTPLVQSLLLIALAEAPVHAERHLVAITDLRESELWGECSRPPNVERVNELLRATNCPTRLSGVKVSFAYCGLRPAKNPRCGLSVTAYEELRNFWRQWVAANGGTATFHLAEPLLND